MDFCEAFVCVCFPLCCRVCNNINQASVFCRLTNAVTHKTLSPHHPVSHIIIVHAGTRSLAHFLKTRSRSFVAKEKTANSPRDNAVFLN